MRSNLCVYLRGYLACAAGPNLNNAARNCLVEHGVHAVSCSDCREISIGLPTFGLGGWLLFAVLDTFIVLGTQGGFLGRTSGSRYYLIRTSGRREGCLQRGCQISLPLPRRPIAALTSPAFLCFTPAVFRASFPIELHSPEIKVTRLPQKPCENCRRLIKETGSSKLIRAPCTFHTAGEY